VWPPASNFFLRAATAAAISWYRWTLSGVGCTSSTSSINLGS